MFILWSSRYLSLSSFPKPHRENNEFLVNCTDSSEKQSLLTIVAFLPKRWLSLIATCRNANACKSAHVFILFIKCVGPYVHGCGANVLSLMASSKSIDKSSCK